MNYPHRLHNMEDIRDTLTDRQKEVLEEILQAKKEEGREEAKAALRKHLFRLLIDEKNNIFNFRPYSKKLP